MDGGIDETRNGRRLSLILSLQAAVRDFDDMGVGHGREEVVQLRRGHHVRCQPPSQAKLAAAAAGGGGREEFAGGPLRDVLHEARGNLGAVGRGGAVVDPLPDLLFGTMVHAHAAAKKKRVGARAGK